jgi:tetratricopeptide (TPR) repeat protein
MKIFLSCIFLLIRFTTLAQNDPVLQELFEKKDHKGIVNFGRNILSKDTNDVLGYHLIGRAYAELGKYDSAIRYLEKAIAMDKDETWISGWSYAYTGYAKYFKGKAAAAKKDLKKCISLNKTKNSVSFAKGFLQSANLIDELDKWAVMERKNIIYYFENKAGLNAEQFMREHDEAYTTINKTFKATLKRKISFYVWENRETAKKILGRELGFSEPEYYLCNVHKNQTIGHEMTHVLSYWAWGVPTQTTSRLINEGVAVCFDLSNRNKTEMAKEAVKKLTGQRSIVDIWENDNKLRDDIIYPVGGAFIAYLLKNSTEQQFRQLIKNQTINNARLVYGDTFEKLVKEFDRSVGLK